MRGSMFFAIEVIDELHCNKAATRSLHSWSRSRCYTETLDEFHKIWAHKIHGSMSCRSKLDCLLEIGHTSGPETPGMGCFFHFRMALLCLSQLIATLFRYLWPALGSARSACCGPSSAATDSSGWCFPLSSLLSPHFPPLPLSVPPTWRCS